MVSPCDIDLFLSEALVGAKSEIIAATCRHMVMLKRTCTIILQQQCGILLFPEIVFFRWVVADGVTIHAKALEVFLMDRCILSW